MIAGQAVRVLVATQAERVYEILEARDVSYDIALYTGTIRELLPEAQLVIIDYEDVVEYPLTETEIREEIFGAMIYECSSADFCANPEGFLDGLAVNTPGKMLTLPEHYCIAFVSYSGGTGRTTLALDTATCFAETMQKHAGKEKRRNPDAYKIAAVPGLVIEFAFGTSALISLTGLDMPSLMRLATVPETQAQAYRGMALVPMDYENVRMIAVDFLERYFHRQMGEHNLTVLDIIWPHELSGALARHVDLWIVVAAERSDTIANAQKLYDELCAEFPRDKVWLLQNQVSKETGGQPTGQAGQEEGELKWHISLPRIRRPDDLKGDLGRVILSKVFAPLWEEYDKPSK